MRIGCRDVRSRWRHPERGPDLTDHPGRVVWAVIPVPRWLSVEDAWDEIATFGQLVQSDPACRWAVIAHDADTAELLAIA